MKENQEYNEFNALQDFFLRQLNKKDDNIYRLKFIVVALCIIIAMLLISNH